MKRALQVLSVVVALAVVIVWIVLGANRGWTKTEKEVRTKDEVTDLEGITYERRFQPGLDFLGVGLVGAGILAGVSVFLRSKSNSTGTQSIQH